MSLTRHLLPLLFGATALAFSAAGARAATLTVAAGGSIQAAIDAAAPGDTVVVAAGTYRERLVWRDKGLTLRGAGAGLTVVDLNPNTGGPGGTCLETSGLPPTARVEGFTFTGGHAIRTFDWDWWEYAVVTPGGGIRNTDSHLTVVGCEIVDNHAYGGFNANGFGGGLCNRRSDVALTDCTVRDNSADRYAGIYGEDASLTLTRCLVRGNDVYNLRAPRVEATDSTFSQAFQGMVNDTCPDVVVARCRFEECGTGWMGGGLRNHGSTVTVVASVFARNNAIRGAAIHCAFSTATIAGCLVVDNVNPVTDISRLSDALGGAISGYYSNMAISHCTVVNNTGSWFGAGIYAIGGDVTVANSVVWGNRSVAGGDTDNLFDAGQGTFAVTHTLAGRSAPYPGAGNLVADPRFVDPAAGNFRLQADSPAVDAGNSGAVPADLTTDLDGRPRILGAAVDMGAYELFRDTTAPVLALPGNLTATATTTAGAVVAFAPTATDDVDGPVSVTCSPASGTTFAPGVTTVTVTAVDAAGNVATATFTVTVRIAWSGILQPVNADGTSVFKAGATVPVKFALTGASAGIADLRATLSYAKIVDGDPGTVNEATSNAAATTGNLFRYDAASGQYVFQWSTKGLTRGRYRLQIDLGDGVARTVDLGLK